MDATFSIDLKEPYHSFLEKGEWTAYMSALSRDGLIWWFNMEIPCLMIHLAPLSNRPEVMTLPPRLLFLTEAIKGFISIESIEKFYQFFLRENDFEAACAAAGAGAASIWDSGSDFKRFDIWYKRIDQLLKKDKSISPLARASLLGFKALIEITYRGDISKAEEVLRSQLFWAEKANSSSLRVFHAVAFGYCFSYAGDLQRFDVVVADTAPLCELPETSLICQVYFKLMQGLFCIIKGEVSEGQRILRETIGHPFFDMLPPSIWLMGNGHLLLAAAFEGDLQEVEAISKKIQNRVVPEHNYFYHSYAHFNMGIAALVLGKPYKALLHGRQTAERGCLSNSPIPERFAALLIGQALSDLGKVKEAIDHLALWLKKWQKAGYQMFAMNGALEISHLLVKKGKIEEARKYYEQATAMLPRGEEIPILYRPPAFFKKLRQSLYPESIEFRDWSEGENIPIRIEVFGELRIRVRDRILYDRKWRGGRTKSLLKALIVYGGTKVSQDLLTDTLWPDADGSMAMLNLKVALSRLRRVGCEKGEELLPWIKVQHRHVSLVKSLCTIDSIQFKNALSAALKNRDGIELLKKVLDLYKDDFLTNDCSELWIIRHREVLREDFIKGVITLSDLCMKNEIPEVAVPYLQKALEKDPLHEDLYGHLMRVYLKMGYPSKALKIFQRAKQILRSELDIEPGPVLLSLVKEASGK